MKSQYPGCARYVLLTACFMATSCVVGEEAIDEDSFEVLLEDEEGEPTVIGDFSPVAGELELNMAALDLDDESGEVAHLESPTGTIPLDGPTIALDPYALSEDEAMPLRFSYSDEDGEHSLTEAVRLGKPSPDEPRVEL